MSFDLSGVTKLQDELGQVAEAMDVLNGDLTTLRFDPADPASVESAIADMESAIDLKLAAYQGNAMVADLAAQAKAQLRERILERSAESRSEDQTMGDVDVDSDLFRQIENTVTDLRRAHSNEFERHINKLSRLIHSPELEKVNQALVENVDLDAWIKAGEATQGGIVGSARLEWPKTHREELGMVISLIDHFTQSKDAGWHFAYKFYYSGTNITNNIHNMIEHVLVPFSRDYISYIRQNTPAKNSVLAPQKGDPMTRKAFVVHGRDEGAREAVARFLERIGFEAIILHERASQGRTIIEKIEAHGEVGFAVVLLTPDDVGSEKGGTLRPRARQNVLLELGYFVARLGRDRVCALKRGDLEIPTDFAGVVYQDFDDGGAWRQSLGKELQAAGFDVDWNKVMRP